MANTTNNDYCVWLQSIGKTAYQGYDYIVMPFVFVLGFVAQSIMLISYCRQAKKESAYRYQIFLAVCDIILVTSRAFYVVTVHWLQTGQVSWFVSSYGCVWISAHLSVPLENMLITTSLLLAVAMSADRVFALGKPFVYKNINHNKHQALACTICATLGVGSSVFQIFNSYPEMGANGFYTGKWNAPGFANSLTATVLNHTRNAIRGFGVVALIASNSIMMLLYRKYLRKVIEIAKSSEVKKRREQQKALAILAISESIGNAFSMTGLLLYYIWSRLAPGFCASDLVGALQDTTTDLTSVANCVIAFAASKSLRKMVFESIPCLKRFFGWGGSAENTAATSASRK